jgi:hypothetical protein
LRCSPRSVATDTYYAAEAMTRPEPSFKFGRVTYFHADCFDWLSRRKTNSVHGVVTDPPFGLEYSERELGHKRNGNRAGVWRLPPAFDGYDRRTGGTNPLLVWQRNMHVPGHRAPSWSSLRRLDSLNAHAA